MSNQNNIKFSISIKVHAISKQSTLKYLNIMALYLMINSIGSLKVKSWWHNSRNHVECCLNLKNYTNISVLKSVYFALFHSYLTYLILN